MSWKLQVYVATPRPMILKSETYLIYDGKQLKPGTYPIRMGSEVKMRMAIQNMGFDGKVRVVLYDENSRKAIKQYDIDMRAGSKWVATATITVNRNMSLKVITYYRHPTTGQYRQYDTYGC